MKVFFDESYPENCEVIILGALFLSDDAYSHLTKSALKLKAISGFKSEMHFSQMRSRSTCDLVKLMADLFLNLEMPYFSCCILPYSETKLADVRGSNLNTKRVELYVNSARKLILSNALPNTDIDLFMDNEERIAITKFTTKILKMRPFNGTKVVNADFIDSALDQNVALQLCDVLTGMVKQKFYPTSSKSGRFKRDASKHLFDEAGVKKVSERKHASRIKALCGKPKIQISTWKLPNKIKSRS